VEASGGGLEVELTVARQNMAAQWWPTAAKVGAFGVGLPLRAAARKRNRHA